MHDDIARAGRRAQAERQARTERRTRTERQARTERQVRTGRQARVGRLARAGRQTGLSSSVALLGALLAGCTVLTGIPAPAAGPYGDPGGTHVCGEAQLDPDALDTLPTADQLTGSPRAALDALDPGAIAVDQLPSWRVVTATDDHQVVLVRALEHPAPPRFHGEVLTHEHVVIHYVAQSHENRPGWLAFTPTPHPCDVRALLDGLGTAVLTLDPDAPPDHDAHTVDLLAEERACAGGGTAEGRIEVVDLELTPTEVRLLLGVTPLEGDVTCPGHDPTPVRLELGEPLGGRPIVDVGVVPHLEVAMPPAS